MSNIARIMQQAAAGAAGEALAIEDVFSTYLYTGNGSTQTITNGIDLAGEGGLVWIKNRSSLDNHRLFTTDIGEDIGLASNNTNGTSANSGFDPYFDFTSSGFAFPAYAASLNTNGTTYASWTFRKAERFFDVVTWTGNGVAGRTIAHNLGVVPGCIIVKKTNTTANWQVYHRSLANTQYLVLNLTNAVATGLGRWNSTTPTSTVFTLGADTTVNANGDTYVAYLFAHDPLGPSGDGSDGLIACGGFTASASVTTTINLGWEPQWVLVKDVSTADNWYVVDNMRGFPFGTSTNEAIANILKPNSADSEFTGDIFEPTATGFQRLASHQYINGGNNYIYIAIRRGPMREPTSGTEVFAPVLGDATPPAFNTTFPVDLNVYKWRTSGTAGSIWSDRLRGATSLNSSNTNAEFGNGLAEFDYMDGFGDSTGFTTAYIGWNFRRAPGFFDVVAYTGTGSLRTVSHNLGAAPDLMIIKSRNGVRTWRVYCRDLTANAELALNLTNAVSYTSVNFNDTDPTDSVFTVNTNSAVNAATDNYIAYLFATLPGVSKVGSYTGNGSNQTINCGFTGGARFVLIKRTDNTGDWYVWDTARGIVAGNDPHLSLNTMAAEVTTNDSIDPDSSGFIVNQLAATNINVSSATYIYLAIA